MAEFYRIDRARQPREYVTDRGVMADRRRNQDAWMKRADASLGKGGEGKP